MQLVNATNFVWKWIMAMDIDFVCLTSDLLTSIFRKKSSHVVFFNLHEVLSWWHWQNIYLLFTLQIAVNNDEKMVISKMFCPFWYFSPYGSDCNFLKWLKVKHKSKTQNISCLEYQMIHLKKTRNFQSCKFEAYFIYRHLWSRYRTVPISV